MTSTEKKVSKREMFEEIKALVGNIEGYDKADEVIAFVDKEIEAIDKKNEKARERNAKKKEASDELRAEIKALLTDEFQTGEEITAKIQETHEDVSKAKVTARLSQLVRSEDAVKTTVKVDKRRIMAYAVAGTEVPVNEDAE